MAYQNLHPGEPNNHADEEHCISLQLWGGVYKGNDSICPNSKTYICKRKMGSMVSSMVSVEEYRNTAACP